MKCKIPEISWHNRDPVLSVDIQPKGIPCDNGATICRLATGGTDAHVLIWYINHAADGKDIELDLAADLTRHQRAVNTVKWSPNGELLASGDDESVVFISKRKNENEPLNILDDSNEQDKEVWITLKVLRGHTEDIYDLSWSPNSQFLVSGSVDNSAMIWDVHKGKSLAILDDHKGYVQGVAWDPKNQYIATLSTDRYLRIFDIQTKRVLHRIHKGILPVAEGHELYNKSMRLFHDGTLQTFFRRLCFTPDGKLLLTPSGVTDYDGVINPLNTTYAFSRYALRQPALVLPSPDQYTVAVSCSPILYCLRPHDAEKNPPIVPLPYRMIYAVATKSSVYFYDTQQKQPFAVISNIHYTRLTDLTWSGDGCIVVVSSTDGFCSLITFSVGELGEIYEKTDAVLGAALQCENILASGKKFKKLKGNLMQKVRKGSTDELNLRKPLLENVNEIQTTSIPIKRKEPTPIAIKRKEEATPIAIKRKPNKQESILPVTQTIDKQNETTSIEVKRKPSHSQQEESEKSKSNSADDEVEHDNISRELIKETATPIAVKQKPSAKQDEKGMSKAGSAVDTLLSAEKCFATENDGMKSNPITGTPIAAKRKISEEQEIEKLNTNLVAVISPKKSDTTATAIAVKRNPSVKQETNDLSTTLLDEDVATLQKDNTTSESITLKPATSIAVKRKTKEQLETTLTPNKSEIILPIVANIIIDKEILSSDEKFESPEKKSRPVTPISVRRHPRTPTSGTKSTTPSQTKRATPIAVRRTPRVLIPTPVTVDAPTVNEEAMDAWPLDNGLKPLPSSCKLKTPNKVVNSDSTQQPLAISDATSDRTEDIRLVYEDTVEEAPPTTITTAAMTVESSAIRAEIQKNVIDSPDMALIENDSPQPKSATPNNRTPRRVAFKTISTPKSKKKILD